MMKAMKFGDSDLSHAESNSPPPVSPILAAKNDQSSIVSSNLAKWIVHFLFFIQMKFRLSDMAISSFLRFFTALFTILGGFSDICFKIAKQFTILCIWLES